MDVLAGNTHLLDHLVPLVSGLDATLWCTPKAGVRADALRLRWRPASRLPRAGGRVVVASWGDVGWLHGRRFVMVEHGAGQTYVGGEPDPGSLPSVCGCRMDLLLAPSERVAARNRLHHPHAVSVAVGAPRLDRVRRVPSGPLPTVAFAFHWDSPLHPMARWAWPHWRKAIEALAGIPEARRGFRMVGAGHPRVWFRLERWWRRLGVKPVRWIDDVYRSADVLVADNTSAMWEACHVGLPIVVLDAPWYDPGVEHGIRFWELADAGLRVGSGRVGELRDAVLETLVSDPCRDERRRAGVVVYGPRDRLATVRAVEAVRSLTSPPESG